MNSRSRLVLIIAVTALLTTSCATTNTIQTVNDSPVLSATVSLVRYVAGNELEAALVKRGLSAATASAIRGALKVAIDNALAGKGLGDVIDGSLWPAARERLIVAAVDAAKEKGASDAEQQLVRGILTPILDSGAALVRKRLKVTDSSAVTG